MRVHTYVIATDAGSAPNYDPPFVTLAVCKPVIRRRANIGDLVLAFAGKKPDRTPTPDNFYRPTPDGGLLWIDNPVHGPEAADHDTGGVYVLTFSPSWRFGAHGPTLPESFGLRMVGGRRGQHVTDLSAAGWKRLAAWLDGHTQVEEVPTSSGGSCTPSRRAAPIAPLRPRRSRC